MSQTSLAPEGFAYYKESGCDQGEELSQDNIAYAACVYAVLGNRFLSASMCTLFPCFRVQ